MIFAVFFFFSARFRHTCYADAVAMSLLRLLPLMLLFRCQPAMLPFLATHADTPLLPYFAACHGFH